MTINALLVSGLPRLRRYALSLTHDPSNADDLVQSAAVKMLIGQDSFDIGSSFTAWATRIVRNEFIDERRRAVNRMPHVDVKGEVLPIPATQERALMAREALRAIQRLPDWKQRALWGAIDGKPSATSTARTRLRRARAALRAIT